MTYPISCSRAMTAAWDSPSIAPVTTRPPPSRPVYENVAITIPPR